MIGKSRNKILSGPAGLAAGDGFGRALLSDYQEISQGGVVWADQPNQAISDISCSEYRRRPWAREFRLVRSILAHCSRFVEGNRNSSVVDRSNWFNQPKRSGTCGQAMRKNRSNVAFAHPRYTGQTRMKLFFSPHLLFAIRFFAEAKHD